MANNDDFLHINDEYVTTLKTLHDVVAFGTPDMIEKFIDQKHVDVNERGPKGMTALHLAASHGDSEKVDKLLDCGANIEAQDEFGRTPLHHVCGRQAPSTPMQAIGKLLFKSEISAYSECAENLIDRGANVNATDGDGWTPLHYSAMHANSKVAETLVENGANLAMTDKLGMSAQDVAFAKGNEKLADRLEPAPVRDMTKTKSKEREMEM